MIVQWNVGASEATQRSEQSWSLVSLRLRQSGQRCTSRTTAGGGKTNKREASYVGFGKSSAPPFRSITISPPSSTWNDAVVVRLAQAAYEERHLPAGTLDNGRLAVLADALEEAGCTDADMLGHLRGPGPHVRGCWPVDLCLGKS